MAITAALVKELRERTGAGMMECKKALVETNGDIEAAADLMRKTGLAKADKKAGRIAAEGLVAIATDGNRGVIAEVNCETDFVSKNETFLAFAQALAALVAERAPADVAALAALPLAMEDFGPTVEDVRKGLVGKIGENMTIRRFVRYAGGGALAHYLHGTRIGVLVEYTGDATAAKDVAMHVAAMKPAALSSSQVPAELVDKERKIAAEKAAESGKPAEIVARMVDGAVQKFLKEVSLLDQVFVKAADGKQAVGQMLKDKATTVAGFTLYVVGEGIEKKAEDFAAEVAAQMAAAKGG